MKEYNLDESTNNELITDQEKINKISEKIFPLLKTKDEVNILSEFYKEEYRNIDLTLCIDTSFNNNTILTELVYYNLTNVIINILSSLSNIYKSLDIFIPYLNQKNSKGYNALLYAAFRGNLEIFKKLLEFGAELHISNLSGLNVLHLAAQGNHPNIIVYLIEKCRFDINSKDNNGNTALHWGVNMDSKQVVDYLVYYNIDINIKNNDGETAFGIAKIKNNQYFIKKFNEDFNIIINKDSEENKEENENYLDNNNNINNEDKKSNISIFFNKFWGTKSINMAAFPFILMIFVLEGTNHIIILKGYCNLYMSFIFFILFFLQLFFYYITSKSDPGEIQTKFLNSLLYLAEQGEDLKNICPWCINNIDENTYHCFLCNKCFENQEFHDIFLNNCIGKRNFGLYLNFLYYLTIVSCFKFVICFWAIFWLKGDFYTKLLKLIISQIIMVSGFIIFGFYKIRDKSKNKNFCLNFGNITIINNSLNNDNSNNKSSIKVEMTNLESS